MNLQAWKRRARRLSTQSYALYLAYRDPRTPWYARVFAALSLGININGPGDPFDLEGVRLDSKLAPQRPSEYGRLLLAVLLSERRAPVLSLHPGRLGASHERPDRQEALGYSGGMHPFRGPTAPSPSSPATRPPACSTPVTKMPT